MPDPTQGLIRVDVTVTDETGHPAVGLSEKDFKLLDNHQEQKIVTFQAFNGGIQPASSFEIVLVIDELNMLANVRSGKKELSAANHEAEAFLRSNRGALEHPTTIYRLTEHGLFAISHASMNGNELADELEHGHRLRRLWSPSEVARDISDAEKGDAVSRRVSQSLVGLGSIAIEERRRPGRKLMFWIGDGWQIESRKARGISELSIELLTRMREARISLWGATMWPSYDDNGNAAPVNQQVDKEYLNGPKSNSTDLGYLSLPVIAERSGGGMLDTSHNLAALISESVKRESRYYSITFDPARTSGVDEYHHLQIRIDRADVTARCLEDYYDEPVFYDQPPVRRLVTVKELEDLMANAHNVSKSELARQLEEVQLTERLDIARLIRLERELRESMAQEALEVVADESAFLAPPADEVLSTPPPDMATQRQILSRVISYVNTAVAKLPDFFATRTTVQYHETPPSSNQNWKTAEGTGALEKGETATASLRFDDGKERVKDEYVTGDQPLLQAGAPRMVSESVLRTLRNSASERLQTIGTFGPILVTVMTAATLPQQFGVGPLGAE